MSGHWSKKCWKLHLELCGTPRKNHVPESMQLEVGSSLVKEKMNKNQSAQNLKKKTPSKRA
jgi:hypothetical protein